MRIPSEKIDEVRQATDIVDLIGGFVKLKKRGKNFVGLCPFHSEKTPSFNVSPERQMYHCFGCGAGGNAFTFLMEYEKVSFAEAVRSLAEQANITLPRYTPEQEAVESEQERLYNVCRLAGLFFYHSLTETTEGKLALEYLRHRGFSEETMKTFGLGYSPNSWDGMIKHAEEQKISMELLERAGLVRRRDDGTYYDYFRGRVMFPIFSAMGRVVGFGARKLREDDPLGKYINSPETSIYNKSRILYGIYQSKESIRENDYAILVEGYADLISVFQGGVKNVVASSGTALTTEQIELIGRYTKNITIVYDADSAGSKAALRGVDLVLERDLDVRVAELPQGDDPDSFVKKHGGEAFRKLVGGAVSFIDFLALTYERQGLLETPEGQAKTVRTIVQSIGRISDELKRNFYIRQVAEKYKLYESTLYRELEKQMSEQRQRRGEPTHDQLTATMGQAPSVELHAPVHGQASDSMEIPVAERDLIHAMLDGGPDVVKFVFDHVSVEDFTNSQSRSLAVNLLNRVAGGAPVDASLLVNELQDSPQRRLIADLVFAKYQLSKGWDEKGTVIEQATAQKIASDAILSIKRQIIEKRIEENLRALKEASRQGEDILPFMRRNDELRAEIKDLESRGIVGGVNES